ARRGARGDAAIRRRAQGRRAGDAPNAGLGRRDARVARALIARGARARYDLRCRSSASRLATYRSHASQVPPATMRQMRMNRPSERKRCTQPGPENANTITAQNTSIAIATGYAATYSNRFFSTVVI